MSETTQDGFLDGRLRVRQPKRGYRAGMDPVLLAACVEARAGDRVLELGCGVGVALLCLLHRVQGVWATGVEVQPGLAELALGNVGENGFEAKVVVGDVASLPAEIRAESFDHVLMNPPFFERGCGSVAENPGRETGRGEQLPLATWIDAGVRRLTPGGRIWIIQRASRLPDILAACGDRVGDIRVLPFAGRAARAPETVVFTAKKGARGPFKLLAPVVLHEGAEHEDGDRHTAVARAVLRDGAALTMDDSA